MAIVVIAMQGNPFSPDYFRARRRGEGDALEHCAMHVALYGPRRSASAFALEEGPIAGRHRAASEVHIGRSAIRDEGDRVVVELDERTTPAPSYNPLRRPVRGRIVLHVEARTSLTLPIDRRAAHLWWPIAPLARVEVELDEPRVSFRGHGYHDANAGEVALDAAFRDWSWSRARSSRGAVLTYDAVDRYGASRAHAFAVSPRGEVELREDTQRAPLPRTLWRIDRHARSDLGASARVIRSLEDGPFYTRALVETRLAGERVLAVQETLAAHRLRRRWVRFCTSYRMRTR